MLHRDRQVRGRRRQGVRRLPRDYRRRVNVDDRRRKRGQSPFVRRPTLRVGARLRAVPANGDRPRFPFVDHPCDQRGSLVADAMRVGINAGKRRVRQFAKHRVVVDADDRDFARHVDAALTANAQHLVRPRVVAGHHAHRLGQSPQPGGQPLVVEKRFLFDTGQPHGVTQAVVLEDFGAATHFLGGLHEQIAALVGEPHPFKPRVGQLPIPALQKVVQRPRTTLGWSGTTRGMPLCAFSPSTSTIGTPKRRILRDLPGVQKPGDHSVRFPLAEPRGTGSSSDRSPW